MWGKPEIWGPEFQRQWLPPWLYVKEFTWAWIPSRKYLETLDESELSNSPVLAWFDLCGVQGLADLQGLPT